MSHWKVRIHQRRHRVEGGVKVKDGIDPDSPQVRKGCLDKKGKYGNRKLAAGAAAMSTKKHGIKFYIYHCKYDSHWHISTTAPWPKLDNRKDLNMNFSTRIGDCAVDKVHECVPYSGWIAIPLCGGLMKRINVYWAYQLGTMLHPLADVKPETTYEEIGYQLYVARLWLDYLLDDSYLPLTVCSTNGYRLLQALDNAMAADPSRSETLDDDPAPAPPARILGTHAYNVTSALQAFETVFSAELQVLDNYFVSKKGIYVTSDLIEHADNIFPDEVKATLPEQARKDIREAGRCLAFDLPTAAGFHIMRGTETVILQWHAQVVGAPPKTRSWASYINSLRGAKADAKILSALDQVRDLHRNPVMHPEVVLTMDEATTLFAIAQGAIIAIMNDIKKRVDIDAKIPALSLDDDGSDVSPVGAEKATAKAGS